MFRVVSYNYKKLAVLLFLLSTGVLVSFMGSLRQGTSQSFVVFWLAAFCMLGSVAHQILATQHEDRGSELVILTEVTLVTVLFGIFRVLLINNFLPGGDDAYWTVASAVFIGDHKDFIQSGEPLDSWPGIQLITLSISLVCQIDLTTIALVSPIFYRGLSLLFIYLVVRRLYDFRTAALACLAFSTFYPLWLTFSKFRPEILAYVLFFASILMLVNRARLAVWETLAHSLLGIVALTAITVTHHLTNAFLIFFFLVTVVTLTLFSPREPAIHARLTPPNILTVLAVTLWLSYLLYIGTPMLESLARLLSELGSAVKTYAELGYAPPPSPTKQVLVGWGNKIFAFVFAGLILYEVLSQIKCPSRQVDLWIGIWVGIAFLFFVGLGVLRLAPLTVANLSSRVFPYSYPFALALASHTLGKIRLRAGTWLLCSVFVGFALFNIFQLEFVPLNPNSVASYSPSSEDGNQEIAAILWAKPEEVPTITTSSLKPMIACLQRTRKYVSDDYRAFKGNLEGLHAYSQIILNQKQPNFLEFFGGGTSIYRTLDSETLTKVENAPWLSRVYSNGEWEVFSVRH